MNPNETTPAAARRAQVLAAAAEVFARTAITPAALAEIARMSKEEIIEEVIARNTEQMLHTLRQAQAAPGPRLEGLIDAVAAGLEQNLAPEAAALHLELMAEAARNPRVAEALREADALAHRKLSELLGGAELGSRIELLSALLDGMRIRALMNPTLSRDALISAARPLVRMLLGAATPGDS